MGWFLHGKSASNRFFFINMYIILYSIARKKNKSILGEFRGIPSGCTWQDWRNHKSCGRWTCSVRHDAADISHACTLHRSGNVSNVSNRVNVTLGTCVNHEAWISIVPFRTQFLLRYPSINHDILGKMILPHLIGMCFKQLVSWNVGSSGGFKVTILFRFSNPYHPQMISKMVQVGNEYHPSNLSGSIVVQFSRRAVSEITEGKGIKSLS